MHLLSLCRFSAGSEIPEIEAEPQGGRPSLQFWDKIQGCHWCHFSLCPLSLLFVPEAKNLWRWKAWHCTLCDGWVRMKFQPITNARWSHETARDTWDIHDLDHGHCKTKSCTLDQPNSWNFKVWLPWGGSHSSIPARMPEVVWFGIGVPKRNRAVWVRIESGKVNEFRTASQIDRWWPMADFFLRAKNSLCWAVPGRNPKHAPQRQRLGLSSSRKSVGSQAARIFASNHRWELGFNPGLAHWNGLLSMGDLLWDAGQVNPSEMQLRGCQRCKRAVDPRFWGTHLQKRSKQSQDFWDFCWYQCCLPPVSYNSKTSSHRQWCS